jgi:hypothetical protein
MERIKLVKITDITPSEYSVKENAEKFIKMKIDNFILRFGQHQTILTAQVNGVNKILDGNQMYDSLVRLGKEECWCCDLGEMDEREYFSYRIFLNHNTNRLNYIEIAEMVNKVSNSEHDLQFISNITGISIIDIRRYKDLLQFDWEAFAKSPINEAQLDLFGEF